MTRDSYTQVQFTQASDLLGASCFTPTERRRWLLEITAMDRSEAAQFVAYLAQEYRRRVGPEQQEAA